MEKTKTALAHFPVRTSILVQWGDMDAALHVNNTVYLRWAEASRIAYFETLQYEVAPKDGQPGFILGWQDCKYIFPVTFPDTIHMGIRTYELAEDRFHMETHFFSERHDRIVAICKQQVVTYDYAALKKVAVPAFLRERIMGLER